MESSVNVDKITKQIDDWSKREKHVIGKRNVSRPIHKIDEIRNQIYEWSDDDAVIAVAYLKNEIGERGTINQIISFMAMLLSIISLIVSFCNHNDIEIVAVVAGIILLIALMAWIYENGKSDYYEELLVIIEASIKERKKNVL